MTAWTSIEAYKAIQSYLPASQRAVLAALCDYWRDRQRAPTASELMEYRLLRGAWKRLSELADKYRAIHRGPARRCTVTGNAAITWHCGPATGQELTHPGADVDPLLRRWGLLLEHAPRLQDGQVVAQILGVSEKRLRQALEKERQRAQTTAK